MVAAGPAMAQQAPNAGTLLLQQPLPAQLPLPPATPLAVETPGAPGDRSGPHILVKAIRIKGATLISEAALAAQLHGLVGQTLSLGELRAGAHTLVGYYLKKGWLARVVLPPQDITDGIVEYQVVEGRRGALTVDNKGRRIDADRVQRFIESRLKAGEFMSLAAIGEAVNILNDQPGADVHATLAAGKKPGEIGVTVLTKDRPLATFTAGVNNNGSSGSGATQAAASLTLANPTGRFDSASLQFNGSQGSIYGRGEYSLAVGDRGLRLGVNASGLGYRLVQSQFSALKGSGSAATAGLTASYPLLRLSSAGLGLTGGVETDQFIDRTVVGETGNRTLPSASLGIGGFRAQRDGLLAGVQSFSLVLAAGNVSQHNASALAADKAGLRTTGDFAKLGWSLGTTRQLSFGWYFDGQARGQFADKNLDGSQQFFLGGPYGVRGYPAAEATGDDGWIVNLNVTHLIARTWRVGGFFDAGGVTVEHAPEPGHSPAHNRYTLASGGVSLLWKLTPNVNFSAVAAAPIGDNPGALPDGKNADGSRIGPRVWTSLTAAF